MPEVGNLLTQTPILSRVSKLLAGVAPEREIPAFASQTFQQRAVRNDSQDRGTPEVILWPDTFNNYFYPETAMAAFEVLRNAGYRVSVPRAALCCGRPLYDYGMLDTAKRLLRQTLDYLRPALIAGTPIVVLEPSCAAVFQDELANLFPHDDDAERLRQKTFLLSEFLQKEAQEFSPPELRAKALVHGHCHQKALVGIEDEKALLARLGLHLTVPDSGCCGMAGSFGFEDGERFDVSMAAGERVLLPAVRAASKDTLIIADGFSCREQIRQATDSVALHSAQVLQMALQRSSTTLGDYPEGDIVEQRYREHAKARRKTAWCLGAMAVAAALFRVLNRRPVTDRAER